MKTTHQTPSYKIERNRKNLYCVINYSDKNERIPTFRKKIDAINYLSEKCREYNKSLIN